MEKEILQKCVKKGMEFAFFKKLPVSLLSPYQLDDKTFVEYHTDPKAKVTLYYALDAGLNAQTDALASETSDSLAAQTYVNVVVVKEGNEDNEGVKALVDVLKSDDIKKFIEETYEGAVVPFEG